MDGYRVLFIEAAASACDWCLLRNMEGQLPTQAVCHWT